MWMARELRTQNQGQLQQIIIYNDSNNHGVGADEKFYKFQR